MLTRSSTDSFHESGGALDSRRMPEQENCRLWLIAWSTGGTVYNKCTGREKLPHVVNETGEMRLLLASALMRVGP